MGTAWRADRNDYKPYVSGCYQSLVWKPHGSYWNARGNTGPLTKQVAPSITKRAKFVKHLLVRQVCGNPVLALW